LSDTQPLLSDTQQLLSDTQPLLSDTQQILPDAQAPSSHLRSFRIRHSSKVPVKILGLDYNKNIFNATLNDDGSVDVELKDGQAAGFIKETIFVKNNTEFLPILSVPVRANILPSVSFKPSYVEFGSVKKGGKVQKTLEITGNSNIKIPNNKISLNVNGEKTENPHDFISAKLSDDMKKVFLTLENNEKSLLKGSISGSIMLENSDPRNQDMNISFYGFLK
jgi:hypothetical protein